MPNLGRSLTWTWVFFWASAASALASFGWAARRGADATPMRVESAVFMFIVFGLFVAITLRTVRQLATAAPVVAQERLLTVSAIGFILVSLALRLR